MEVLYVLIGLLVLLVVIVIARTLSFRPKSGQPTPGKALEFDKQRAMDSLAQMVKIPTISSDRAAVDEKAFADFREYLKTRYPLVHEKAYRVEIGDSGVLFHLAGEKADTPTVLMAHYDVVPVTDTWTHPPFCGELIDGELWGRGTLDTKGTLCSILEAAEDLLQKGFEPKNDLYLAFSGDEEVMGDSAPAIVSYLTERGIVPAMVVDEGGAIVSGIFPGVSSPCAVIGISEKGKLDIELEAKSEGGHSSAPPRHTPVGVIARAVCRIEDHPFPMSFSPAAKGMLDTLGRQSSFGIRLIFANLWLFSPLVKKLFGSKGGEMNALLRTTCAATMAEGSKQVNVLPAKATAGINLRLNTGDTVEDALARIRKTIGDDSVLVKVLYGMDPSPSSDTDSPQYRLLETVIGENWPGTVSSPYPMLACSDSRHYAKICRCVYRFSAMELSSQQRGLIHADNERIKPETLHKCVEFYLRLMAKL